MKKLLTKNLGMKLLSLLLAILIWVMIMNYDDPYITDTIEGIPVSILNETAVQEKNKMFEIESGKTVSITIRGKRSIIDQLRASNFTATADFKQLSIVNAVPIEVVPKRTTKYSTSDIEILSKTPEVMVLSLEESGEQTFRVDVVTTGEVAAGYYITNKQVNPSVIKITGSQKQISKINQVVVKVNVKEADETLTVNVAPIAYDENNYPVDSSKISYGTTEVQTEIEILPTKEITLKITQQGEAENGYICTDLLSKPEKITIAGTEEELKKIGTYLVIPYDISGLDERTSVDIDLEAYLDKHYPGNQFILTEDSKTVSVTAEIEKLSTKDFYIKTSDIIFKNVADGLTPRFKTEGEIKVKVMARAAILEELTVEDLKLYIDAQGLTAGLQYEALSSDTKAEIKMMLSNVSFELVETKKE